MLRFASTIGFVHETHYGRLFDVRVEPQAINLAYTSLGLPLHTDNPYHDPVPPVQILHCLRPAVSGGANRLSDGFAAAEQLRVEDPRAFELLASRPLVFRYNGGGFDHSAERTVIDCRQDGSIRTAPTRALTSPSRTVSTTVSVLRSRGPNCRRCSPRCSMHGPMWNPLGQWSGSTLACPCGERTRYRYSLHRPENARGPVDRVVGGPVARMTVVSVSRGCDGWRRSRRAILHRRGSAGSRRRDRCSRRRCRWRR